MKNKVLMVAAVIAAAALTGGATAYVVLQAGKATGPETHTTGTIPDPGFSGAGSHFTTFTDDGYPDLTYAAENAVKAVVSVIKTEEIASPTEVSIRCSNFSASRRGSYGSIIRMRHVTASRLREAPG